MSRRKLRVREAYVVESDAQSYDRSSSIWLLVMLIVMVFLFFRMTGISIFNRFTQTSSEPPTENTPVPAQILFQSESVPVGSGTADTDNAQAVVNYSLDEIDGRRIVLLPSPTFKMDFTAIFHCRESASSERFVEEYVMAWWLMHRDTLLHIKNSKVSLDLLSQAPYMSLMNGQELAFQTDFGAGEGVFVQAMDEGMPIISGEGSQIGGVQLTVSETEEQVDVGLAGSHHQVEISIEKTDQYTTLVDYPQHMIRLILVNRGNMKMRNVWVTGVVAEPTASTQDYVLDLVQMASFVPVIEEGGQQMITLTSPAYMDRCVQRQLTANEPRLHLWVTYMSVDDNHVLTDYIEVDSLQPEARGRG